MINITCYADNKKAFVKTKANFFNPKPLKNEHKDSISIQIKNSFLPFLILIKISLSMIILSLFNKLPNPQLCSRCYKPLLIVY
jgi:hypothetical protein